MAYDSIESFFRGWVAGAEGCLGAFSLTAYVLCFDLCNHKINHIGLKHIVVIWSNHVNQ